MMTSRYTKVPVIDPAKINGLPYYTDGVLTHYVVIDEVWSCDAQAHYDHPETVWKEKCFEEQRPLLIEDKNGNPVE